MIVLRTEHSTTDTTCHGTQEAALALLRVIGVCWIALVAVRIGCVTGWRWASTPRTALVRVILLLLLLAILVLSVLLLLAILLLLAVLLLTVLILPVLGLLLLTVVVASLLRRVALLLLMALRVVGSWRCAVGLVLLPVRLLAVSTLLAVVLLAVLALLVVLIVWAGHDDWRR